MVFGTKKKKVYRVSSSSIYIIFKPVCPSVRLLYCADHEKNTFSVMLSFLVGIHAKTDVKTDGQSRLFGQNRKMPLIYHFNGDREVIEEKKFKYSQKV
jgi:hypothetical protein